MHALQKNTFVGLIHTESDAAATAAASAAAREYRAVVAAPHSELKLRLLRRWADIHVSNEGAVPDDDSMERDLNRARSVSLPAGFVLLQRAISARAAAETNPRIDSTNNGRSVDHMESVDAYLHGKESPRSSKARNAIEHFTWLAVRDAFFLRRFANRSGGGVWITIDSSPEDDAAKRSATGLLLDRLRSHVACTAHHVLVTRSDEMALNRCLSALTRCARLRLTTSDASQARDFHGSASLRLAFPRALHASHSVRSSTDEESGVVCTTLADWRAHLGCEWWADLLAEAVRERLRDPSPLLQQDPHPLASGTRSQFLEFVVRLARARALPEFVWKRARVRDAAEYALVLIDSRERAPLSVASIICALSSLRSEAEGTNWGVHVFCAPGSSAAYMARNLRPHFQRVDDDLVLHELPELGAPNGFDAEAYSALLKTGAVWNRLRECGVEACVVVQDDGFLVRPGVEDLLRGPHAYVGAPWREGQDMLRAATNPQLVGNGGLSVRRVADMVAACERGMTGAGAAWKGFVNAAMAEPEDVFFAREVGVGAAPREVARRFSSEQVLCHDSLGFHKPWPYHTSAEIRAFFDSFLADEKPLRS